MTERAYPFVHQVLEARALRVFLFCLSLGTLAYFDLRMGGVMLDPNSVYPFLILLVVPAGLSFKLGWGAISIVRRACVTIGIMVCAINLVVTINNLSDISSLRISMRLMYSPLALGIVMSYLFSLIEPIERKDLKISYLELIGLLILAVIAILGALAYVSAQISGMSLFSFYEKSSSFIAILVISICFSHPNFRNDRFLERLSKSSLAVVLIFVISGVSTYTFASSIDNLAAIGSFISDSTVGILYGSIIALFTIVAGGQAKQSRQETILFDWHLVEAYAFYALIIFPPLSVIEYASLVLGGGAT